jgi:hypothetical protein
MLISLLPALLMSTTTASAPPTICPNLSYVCCWPPSRLDPEHAKRSTHGALQSSGTSLDIFYNLLTLEVGGPTALLASVYEAITGSKTGKAKSMHERRNTVAVRVRVLLCMLLCFVPKQGCGTVPLERTLLESSCM